MFRQHRAAVFLGLLALLLLVLFWAASSGAITLSILHPTPAESAVLWNLRLPRIVLGILTGSTLAVCGGLIQGLFRNPLADPGLIGVSSGAALGAVSIIVIGKQFFPTSDWLHHPQSLPWAAFLGAAAVCFLIQRLGTAEGRTSVATLLLAGVAINALVGAFIGFCTYLATDEQLRSLTFWTLGSLGAASWSMVLTAGCFCMPVILLAPRFAPLLNALALSEADALHLGFRVEPGKRLLLFLVVIGVGITVSLTGMIGFISLIVPHLLRLLVGPDHRWLLPGGALLGAILLVAADTFARTILAPAEIPIGIVTAAFGAPVFLGLLWQQRRKSSFV